MAIDLGQQKVDSINNLATTTNYIIVLLYNINQENFLIYLLLPNYSEELTFLLSIIDQLFECRIFLVSLLAFSD